MKKSKYIAPQVKVIGLEVQGIICQSNRFGTGNPFGDNFETDW